MDGCTREKWILLYSVHPLLQSAVVRARGILQLQEKGLHIFPQFLSDSTENVLNRKNILGTEISIKISMY